jgi:hypothetical protein
MDSADGRNRGARLKGRDGALPWGGGLRISVALITLAAFVLYTLSSLAIVASDRQYLFGADAILYVELASKDAAAKIGGHFYLDRITRFHPATTVAALVWMKLLWPLTAWMSPEQLLRAMFAFAGAAGVCAAMAAFARFVPRGQVALWGIIYAASLAVWFFSSIEESKIVTATLAALYIATYLRLRTRWTTLEAGLLTGILLIACLNEIVAAFLLVIPAVDTLVQRGWDLRSGRWIAWHGLAAPAAFVLLETVVHRYTGGATAGGPEGEAGSHVGMLAFYLSRNDVSIDGLYAFLANWTLFAIAAPTPETTFAAFPADPEFKGYFAPALAGYLSSPASSALAVAFGTVLIASLTSLVPQLRREPIGPDRAGVLLGLAAYSVARAAFYFVVHTREAFLFASGATLAQLLVLAALFAASRFPAQRALLAVCALLLLVVNGTFVIGE